MGDKIRVDNNDTTTRKVIGDCRFAASDASGEANDKRAS
jgi:hypothetical protein